VSFNTTQHILAIETPNSSPQTFDRIAEVGDIGAMGSKATMHDTSSHSTGDGWGSQRPGLLRQKPFTAPVFFDPSNAQHALDVAGGLGYMHEHPEDGPWLFLEHPHDQPEYATKFYAYIGEIGRPVPVDGILTMQVTFEPTGKPVHFDATALTVNP